MKCVSGMGVDSVFPFVLHRSSGWGLEELGTRLPSVRALP